EPGVVKVAVRVKCQAATAVADEFVIEQGCEVGDGAGEGNAVNVEAGIVGGVEVSSGVEREAKRGEIGGEGCELADCTRGRDLADLSREAVGRIEVAAGVKNECDGEGTGRKGGEECGGASGGADLSDLIGAAGCDV